jgi:group I intron endonuclease
MIGIYKITNLINGKIYIGQSNNIKRRFGEHQRLGYKSRILVDKAIAKYGVNNFSYEVLEECPLEKLNERE